MHQTSTVGRTVGRPTAREAADLVTVVVPARDEQDFIGACLDSVIAQDHVDLQIIVVDSDSSDATAAVVQDRQVRDPRIELLRAPGPGISVALNTGLAAARGRWLVRVDAHSTVGPDYVTQAVSRLSSGRWGGVGGWKSGVGVTPAGRAVAAAMSSRFGVGGSVYHYGTHPAEVDHVPFGAYPTALLRELGGWDPAIAANEDFELDQRIRGAGYSLLFEPRLVIDWHCRQSVGELFVQYRRYGAGKLPVALRHKRSVRPRHLLPPALVGYLGVAALVALRHPAWSAAAVAPYAGAVAAASLATGRRLETGRERLHLPGAFVAMHVGWGLGFWQAALGHSLGALRGRTIR